MKIRHLLLGAFFCNQMCPKKQQNYLISKVISRKARYFDSNVVLEWKLVTAFFEINSNKLSSFVFANNLVLKKSTFLSASWLRCRTTLIVSKLKLHNTSDKLSTMHLRKYDSIIMMGPRRQQTSLSYYHNWEEF